MADLKKALLDLDEDDALITLVEEVKSLQATVEEAVAGITNGTDGESGINGKDGKNGRDGVDGINGRDGKDGKQGPKGDKGDRGERGPKGEKGDDADIEDLKPDIEKIRAELLSIAYRGGSMNRKETFNGTDSLTRYTDINWKAGTNVTFTVSNNDATKQVDVTISATGGSGSGITRSINSVSVDTAAGSAPTIDYVYLVSGTTTITLPDATANTNLYTVKNVGTGTVTVATTSAQTIDGALTQVMPVQFTSIDMESDGSNWNIT